MVAKAEAGHDAYDLHQVTQRTNERGAVIREEVGLLGEIALVNERMRKHIEQAKSADKLVFFIGCDDSRVDVPTGIHGVDGKQTVFQFIPAIGGGVPSIDMLHAVISNYLQEGVDHNKFVVMVTQHGSTEEIEARVNQGDTSTGETCGARAVARKNPGLKGLVGDPEAAQHAAELSTQTGFPRQLILTVAELQPDILENEIQATLQTQQMLAKLGYGAIPVVGGYYDHKAKMVHLAENGDGAITTSIEMPKIEKWKHEHQDPATLVLSYGPKVASYPDGVILNRTVGEGYNNDFNAAAVSKDRLMAAFSELWYAISHNAQHVEPDTFGHAHNANFKSAERVIVAVDDAQHAQDVIELMQTTQFKNEMKPLSVFGGIYLVNVADNQAEFVPFAA
ncbi:MAG TPA: hypothetical protein VD999_02135 [Vitreimonas sp.]|nr:hypothetical protein [Vitreimonas sp.]